MDLKTFWRATPSAVMQEPQEGLVNEVGNRDLGAWGFSRQNIRRHLRKSGAV